MSTPLIYRYEPLPFLSVEESIDEFCSIGHETPSQIMEDFVPLENSDKNMQERCHIQNGIDILMLRAPLQTAEEYGAILFKIIVEGSSDRNEHKKLIAFLNSFPEQQIKGAIQLICQDRDISLYQLRGHYMYGQAELNFSFPTFLTLLDELLLAKKIAETMIT